jgi:hypothetical protein
MSYTQNSSAICALLTALVLPTASHADGLSAVQSCETDSRPPEEIARLQILPNGESRGSDTAATLIIWRDKKPRKAKMSKQYNGPCCANSIRMSRKPSNAIALPFSNT